MGRCWWLHCWHLSIWAPKGHLDIKTAPLLKLSYILVLLFCISTLRLCLSLLLCMNSCWMSMNCCILVLRGNLYLWLFHRASGWKSCYSWHHCYLCITSLFRQGKTNTASGSSVSETAEMPGPGTPSFLAATRSMCFLCIMTQSVCLKGTSLYLHIFLSSCTRVQHLTAHCLRWQSVLWSCSLRGVVKWCYCSWKDL